jgi:hypothetical protein
MIKAKLMQFRYDGPTDGAHVVPTDPFTVVEMTDQQYLDERHPCDLCFLPDVELEDAGCLLSGSCSLDDRPRRANRSTGMRSAARVGGTPRGSRR